MRDMAHRDKAIVPADPRMRAYWKWHVDGAHPIPREGVKPDHFYSCDWCDPRPTAQPGGRYGYGDGEREVFKLPQSAAKDPWAAIAGRLG